MTPDAQVILESWSAPIGVNVSLCLAALAYTKGWLHLHKVFPNLISAWRLAAFFAGIVSLWIAIGSPVEAFDDVSFSVHMVQHLLLMAVAPPLILLGAPTLPLLRGLPRPIAHGAVGRDRKSTRLNSSHQIISYAVFCLKKKKIQPQALHLR